MTPPGINAFHHLTRMSDNRGLFEHAIGATRDERHGYCTDDNARLLLVASRAPDTGPAQRLGRLGLNFILDAKSSDGRCRNRLDRAGRWTDDFGTEDCWGRSIWALGSTAAHHQDERTRAWAIKGFDSEVRQRSPWPRAMAFAALGAADVLAIDPANEGARSLLADTLTMIGPVPAGDWAWPEPRLSYANATLAEAVIAAGAALERPDDLERGLAMLAWLLALETPNGHLSLTGVGGRGPGDASPQFDQQPIEAAAMADACWRAHAATGDLAWSRGVAVAAGWFTGDNDAGARMYDEVSGGAFDGLHADGVNINQGAESTLALVSTMQRAHSFAATA
jgi:hypothetical protein